MSIFKPVSDPCPRCPTPLTYHSVVHNTQNGVVACGVCVNSWSHIGDFKREVAAKALAKEAYSLESDEIPELHDELEELVSLVRETTWKEVQDALNLAIRGREVSVIIDEDDESIVEKNAEILALKSMLDWVNGKLKDEK